MAPIGQEQFLEAQAEFIVARCTTCGKCVEVFPMRGHTSIEADDPGEVASGIIGLLRSDEPSEAARIFVNACSGSALCREVWPDGIDPYNMMRLAKVRLARLNGKRPPPSDYKLIDGRCAPRSGRQSHVGSRDARRRVRGPKSPSTWAATSCGRRISPAP